MVEPFNILVDIVVFTRSSNYYYSVSTLKEDRECSWGKVCINDGFIINNIQDI